MCVSVCVCVNKHDEGNMKIYFEYFKYVFISSVNFPFMPLQKNRSTQFRLFQFSFTQHRLQDAIQADTYTAILHYLDSNISQLFDLPNKGIIEKFD